MCQNKLNEWDIGRLEYIEGKLSSLYVKYMISREFISESMIRDLRMIIRKIKKGGVK